MTQLMKCMRSVKECVYISDKKENFEDDDDENEQVDTEKESGHQADESSVPPQHDLLAMCIALDSTRKC